MVRRIRTICSAISGHYVLSLEHRKGKRNRTCLAEDEPDKIELLLQVLPKRDFPEGAKQREDESAQAEGPMIRAVISMYTDISMEMLRVRQDRFCPPI